MGLMACEKQNNNDNYYGVVEGFYGRPWGTEGRKSMITFLGDNGLDLYVYGPKDDPYHTDKWAEPYPEKEREDFKLLLATAKQSKVKFYWAIHLGSAFKNIDEYRANKEKVFAKFEDMYAMGFRHLGVFFDDFGNADAEMHTTICNEIVNEFLNKKKDLLSVGSKTTPLLNILVDQLYYISGFLTFVSHHDISKQLFLYRPKTSLIDLYGAFSINLRNFIHRVVV